MPAKFEFRLQPLLDWRKRVEQEKQRDFAAIGRIVEDCTLELERLADVRRQCTKQLGESARTRSPADLRLFDAHLRSLEAAMSAQRQRRYELEADWRRLRDELILANRERRVIEKLKERRRRAFEAEEARREEIELDETNARRYDQAARERLAYRKAESGAP
jgi:flagellar FliJ protein